MPPDSLILISSDPSPHLPAGIPRRKQYKYPGNVLSILLGPSLAFLPTVTLRSLHCTGQLSLYADRTGIIWLPRLLT